MNWFAIPKCDSLDVSLSTLAIPTASVFHSAWGNIQPKVKFVNFNKKYTQELVTIKHVHMAYC